MDIFALQIKGIKMKYLIALFSILLVLTACNSEPDVIKNESGLSYTNDVIGTGKEIKEGDLISIHFKGWIINDSTNLFADWTNDSTKNMSLIASSYESPQPMKYVLGSEGFIKGSDEGMFGMMVGGKRTIIIPSNLAYGNEGFGPIPPNSSIKLVVEIVEAKESIQAKMWDVDSTKLKATKSGLKYSIVSEGEGTQVDSGKVVTVHYSGFLVDGTKFDSSIERDEPFTLTVGVGQVIPGWDEGLKLLKQGSKARLVIPSEIGYGAFAIGKIPANSTLIFDVEILEVK